MKAAPAIGFRYRASPGLVIATLLIAVLALIAAFNVSGPPWLHHLLVAGILASTVTAVYRLLRPVIASLLWRAEGGVELRLRDRTAENGGDALGAVQDARVVGPLIVLTLRWPPRECASLWLLPDNLDADTRRRLRMRLAASGGHGGVSGDTDSG